MAERILLTPQELRDAAEFLENASQEVEEKINAVSSKIEEVTENWEGAAQSTFVDNYGEIKPVLSEQFPDVITGLATQLRSVADNLEATDEQLASSMKG